MSRRKIFSITRCSSQYLRLYCSQHPKDTVSPPKKITQYFIKKFVKFIEKYENFLESKTPSVFHIYRTFKTGFKDLLNDTRTYYNISTQIWKGRELHTFSRRELVIYRQLPKEMVKATPILFISFLPGGGFIFPIAYMYPKLFLTEHFWTRQLKTEVLLNQHKKRLKHYPMILDHLNHRSQHIENSSMQKKLVNIIQKLEHSQNPTIEELLEVKPLFEDRPYKIEKLPLAYCRHISKSLGLSLSRNRLEQEGLLLLHTDLAMLREGFDSLTDEELERACFCRGVNADGLNRKEKIEYLKTWTEISKNVDENSISLLLHSPVFLSYNYPTNRTALVRKRIRWRRPIKPVEK